MSFEEDLRLAVGGQGLGLSAGTVEALAHLDRILLRWSEKIGLIGFRTRAERIRRYFAEPLCASKWLPWRGRALDIGSGEGGHLVFRSRS